MPTETRDVSGIAPFGSRAGSGITDANSEALEALSEYYEGRDDAQVLRIWNSRDSVKTHYAVVLTEYGLRLVRLWEAWPDAQQTFNGFIVTTDREVNEVGFLG